MTDYADLEVSPEIVLRGWIEADPSFREERRAAAVDPDSFRAAMRLLAAGVVMVTARVESRVWGLTISSCCSISATPPQVLISLATNASCLPAILETRRFGLSILRAHQRPLAELGAVPGARKHVDAFCEQHGAEPSARIAGALCHLDCRVEQTFEVADHVLVIGTVEAITRGADAEDDLAGPLLYFNRTFHALGRPLT